VLSKRTEEDIALETGSFMVSLDTLHGLFDSFTGNDSTVEYSGWPQKLDKLKPLA
jgi:hypothetical protein